LHSAAVGCVLPAALEVDNGNSGQKMIGILAKFWIAS